MDNLEEMDKFLEIYNLKPNQEETENKKDYLQQNWISNKKLPLNISSGTDSFTPVWIFSSVQLLSRVWLCNPITAAGQASLSVTSSQSLPKLMSIESVIQSNHLILWCPLLPLPLIFLSIRVFSNESVLHIRWPKYWSFSFKTSPSNE